MHLPMPLALLAVAVLSQGPALQPPDALRLAAISAPAPPSAEGAVIGRIVISDPGFRRWANRYPSVGRVNDRLHDVRPVVWLEGDLPSGQGNPGTATIEQIDGQFTPGALAVRTGTIVAFPNEDPFYHNVFSYSGPRFDLGRYPVGDSRSVTFSEPGLVRIFCEIHEFMRAIVVVTDHPFHAVVDENGDFRLPGVPDGEYTLHVFHPDAGSRELSVTVQGGTDVRADVTFGS